MIGLAFLCVLCTPQDETRIASWIEQLGDESLDVREKAVGELVKAGRAAEKRLREAQKSPNAEIRARSLQVLAEIERHERTRLYDPAPSLITLQRQNAPLREVLAEIQRQTATPLEIVSVPGEDKVTVSFEKIPLFLALDALCREHGGIDYAFKCDVDHSRVTLSPGKPQRCPQAVLDQFVLRLASIRMRTEYDLQGAGKASTTFYFDWGWEHGTRHEGGRILIDELRDDAGTSYAPDPFDFPHAEPNWLSRQVTLSSGCTISRLPPQGATRFVVIKGALEVLFPRDVETLSFDDPPQKIGTTQEIGEWQARLASFDRFNKKLREVRVRLEVRPGGVYDRLEIGLVDQSGKVHGSRSMGGTGSEEGMVLTLDFSLPEGAEPASVRISNAIGSRVKRVPFEFRDVRFR